MKHWKKMISENFTYQLFLVDYISLSSEWNVFSSGAGGLTTDQKHCMIDWHDILFCQQWHWNHYLCYGRDVKRFTNWTDKVSQICDPIWQNETEVAFWGIGVIIRSWIFTKLPLKWGVTQACRLNSSKDLTWAKSENINLKIVLFWENAVQRWWKFFFF